MGNACEGRFCIISFPQGPASTGRGTSSPPLCGKHGEHVARIAGVNIPTNKRVVIALQYIHGIGPKKAAGNLREGAYFAGAPGASI